MPSLTILLGKIVQFIVNPIIILGFVIATIVFFYGVINFIAKADDAGAREEGKRTLVYGLVGLFVMFSVYGILRFILVTFGIPYPSILAN